MLHKKFCVDSTLGSPDWTVRGNEYTVHVVPPGSLQPLKWGRLYQFWFNHYIEILTKSFLTEFLGAKKLRSIEDELKSSFDSHVYWNTLFKH